MYYIPINVLLKIQAVEYKPADPIFRVTSVGYSNSYHACLT